MRIAIDTTQAKKTQTGLVTYADNIIDKIESIDKKNKYYHYNAPKLIQSKFFIVRLINAVIEILWRQMVVPIKLLWNKIEIYYTPGFYSPYFSTAKKIVVIHDLIFLKYPKEYNLLAFKYLKYSTDISVKRSDLIFATSSYTKKDINKKYPEIDDAKVKVVYAAAGEHFKKITQSDNESKFRKKYRLDDKYLMYAGGVTLHKNIRGLIRIFAEFKKIKNNFKEEKYNLVMPGPNNISREAAELIKKLNLEDDIVYPGYIPLEDLVKMYNYAEVFVFPSYYEGFGMPPLEAMRCGCPVVSSDRTSLQEVVGEAGLLIDPDNHQEFAAGVNKIVSDQKFREELIQKGFEQAKRFSWEKSAKKSIELFESLI